VASKNVTINCFQLEAKDTKITDIELSSPLYSSISLRRMVSFAGIGSAPMYDIMREPYEDKYGDYRNAAEPSYVSSGGRIPKKMLKLHEVHDSSEFQELRLFHAKLLVTLLAKKLVACKRGNPG